MGRSTCFSCGGSGRVERVEQGSPYDGTNYHRYFDNCSHCNGKGYWEYDDPYVPDDASAGAVGRSSQRQADPDQTVASLLALGAGACVAYIVNSKYPTYPVWILVAAFVAPSGLVYFLLRRLMWLTRSIRYAITAIVYAVGALVLAAVVIATYDQLRDSGQVSRSPTLEWLRQAILWIWPR